MKITSSLTECIAVIKKGGVVAFPTETSFGLLSNMYDQDAKERIFAIKKRMSSKTLSVLVKDYAMATEIIHTDKRIKNVFNSIYPAPLTIVAKAKKPISYISKNNSIALRVSPKKEIQEMFKEIDFPLTATSANESGNKDLYTANEVYQTYHTAEKAPDLVYQQQEVEASKPKPSTIIDLTQDEIVVIRKGAFKIENIKL